MSFWPKYDLIKQYFDNVNFENLDRTLWLYCVANHPSTVEATRKRKFNLLGLLSLIRDDYIPLLYKDDVLLVPQDDMLKEQDIYNKQTVMNVIDSIIEALTMQNITMDDFKLGLFVSEYPVMRIFPYTITLPLTDYGYAVNLFKMSNDLQNKLIKVKWFDGRLPFYIKAWYGNVKIHHTITEAKSVKDVQIFRDNQGLEAKYYFGFDDDYTYIYTLNYNYAYSGKNKGGNLCVNMLKIPFNIMQNVEVSQSEVIIRVNNQVINFISAIHQIKKLSYKRRGVMLVNQKV